MKTHEITIDERLLITLRNNEANFPEDYIVKTVDLYQGSGIKASELIFFFSLLRDQGKISKDEYLKVEDFLFQRVR
jgi:hypothetical protein